MPSSTQSETIDKKALLAKRLRPKLTRLGVLNLSLFAIIFGLYFTGTISQSVFVPLLLVSLVMQTEILFAVIIRTQKQLETDLRNHSRLQDES